MTEKALTTTALNARTDHALRTEIDILKAAKLSFRTHPRRVQQQQQQAAAPREESWDGGWGNPDLQR